MRFMGDAVLIALWIAMWLGGLFLAFRMAMWLLRTIVGATGRAWRGE
jgi:hypothetical protein